MFDVSHSDARYVFESILLLNLDTFNRFFAIDRETESIAATGCEIHLLKYCVAFTKFHQKQIRLPAAESLMEAPKIKSTPVTNIIGVDAITSLT